MDLAHSKSRLSRDEVLGVLASQLQLNDVRMLDLEYENLELDGGFKMDVDTTTLIPDATFVMLPSFNDPTLGLPLPARPPKPRTPSMRSTRASTTVLLPPCSPIRLRPTTISGSNGSALPVLQDAVSTFKANVL